ncbi:hypothetical protein RclHR1_27300001 [Rhizophagus clarus]|uniref:Uncharacterized protein n=1 Tax=Rhizophagus clarus TaxID=94130 RepID=A0A2Z6R2Z6_9GLOM|nr:hypothetical protein RclHR1_27300001 [Rhizophagus clarus]
MPFLLNQFLKESSLKHNEAIAIQQRIDALRINLVLKSIISCWVYIAKTMKTVFNKEFTSDSYKELQQYLEEEFSILPKVFANFINLPNIHVNMHLLMHAKTFRILTNIQVVDGGIDPRFNRPCTGFTNLGQLFLNWYVTEDTDSDQNYLATFQSEMIYIL